MTRRMFRGTRSRWTIVRQKIDRTDLCVALPDAIQCANWARKAVILSIRKRWRGCETAKAPCGCAPCQKMRALALLVSYS